MPSSSIPSISCRMPAMASTRAASRSANGEEQPETASTKTARRILVRSVFIPMLLPSGSFVAGMFRPWRGSTRSDPVLVAYPSRDEGKGEPVAVARRRQQRRRGHARLHSGFAHRVALLVSRVLHNPVSDGPSPSWPRVLSQARARPARAGPSPPACRPPSRRLCARRGPPCSRAARAP